MMLFIPAIIIKMNHEAYTNYFHQYLLVITQAIEYNIKIQVKARKAKNEL